MSKAHSLAAQEDPHGDLTWWQFACDAGASGKPVPAFTEAQPQRGFYRLPVVGAAGIPAAIWRQDGEWLAAIGFNQADAVLADVWPRCAQHPVTEDVYRKAVADGCWPDEPAARRENGGAAGIGDNSGAQIPPYDQLVLEINEKVADAAKVLNDHPGDLTSKDEADALEAVAAWLRDADRRAEKMRVAEKEPHLKAGREVDAKFKTLAKRIETVLTSLNKKVNAWMRAEQKRIQAEIDEKNRIAREEYERQRAEAEALAMQQAERDAANAAEVATAEAAAEPPLSLDGENGYDYRLAVIKHIKDCALGFIGGEMYPLAVLLRELEEKVVIDASFGDLEETARKTLAEALEKLRAAQEKSFARIEVPVEIEAPKAQVGGVDGARRRSLKVKVVARITNWQAALDHFKNAPEVRDAVQRLATWAIRGGETVPGAEAVEEE